MYIIITGSQCTLTLGPKYATQSPQDLHRIFTLRGNQEWLNQYPVTRAQFFSLEDRRQQLISRYGTSQATTGVEFCQGVLVLGVREGSSAHLAGLKQLDEIFSVETKLVESFSDIQV
jgi:hypothetical protein